MWRVGSGEQINIWDDPWLLRDLSRLPLTPRGRNLVRTVDDLIDPVTKQWDIPLLQQTFLEEDVQAIRSIPIHQEMEDVVGWHFDAKGQFSVKSAYKVQRNCKLREQRCLTRAGTGSSDGGGDFWNRLWKLECPPKVKHFLWRMSHNTLPVKRMLSRRGVKTDTLCNMCNRLDKDGAHLFFKCKEAKTAWRELNLERIRCALTEAGSARGVMETILKLKGKEQLTVILLLWMWWDGRNKRRENERKHTPAEVAYMAAAYAKNYLCKETEVLLPDNRQSPSWEKPPGGWCKLTLMELFIRRIKVADGAM